MKLHTVFITHNRLELTKQAIESYLETVTVPFTAVVVDNGSTDGTLAWLVDGCTIPWISCGRNHYPGWACNLGWQDAPDDATHLQRADNDMVFLPGWCAAVEARFHGRVGQVGLRTNAEENNCAINTGGNCVIRRQLWDKGLRWDERPWPKFPAGCSEDTYFSPAVNAMGYSWTRVRKPCLKSLAPDMRDPAAWRDPYYRKTFGDRRIRRPR